MNIEATSEGIRLNLLSSQTIDYKFDWDRVKVLDEELNFNKRLISEMIHIEKAKT